MEGLSNGLPMEHRFAARPTQEELHARLDEINEAYWDAMALVNEINVQRAKILNQLQSEYEEVA